MCGEIVNTYSGMSAESVVLGLHKRTLFQYSDWEHGSSIKQNEDHHVELETTTDEEGEASSAWGKGC